MSYSYFPEKEESGKSTVSTQLAMALANSVKGDGSEIDVGLLDIDICGPSVPRMLALEG
jgi:Mrp family chromosome partitioning ATPase